MGLKPRKRKPQDACVGPRLQDFRGTVRMHNSRRIIPILCLAVFFAVAVPLAFRASPAPDTLVIINAQLADGTGAPLINGALRIRGNRIMSVGKLSPAPGERVIDARGMVLAPGFIDVHNHSLEGLDSDPLAETQIAQGITTAVEESGFLCAAGDSPVAD
jgi:hypothetical protein